MASADRLLSNLWELTAPPPPSCPPLEADVARDVVVIGAGFTGLACALRLAERGASVAVLEANGIGHGGSGRNVGLVNAGTWMRPDDLLAAMPGEAGERLLSALSDAPATVFRLAARYGIACEAVHEGTLHLAAGSAGLAEIEARAAQWRARGAPVELIGEEAARELSGARGFRGALLDRRAGTIQPLAYARGLARAAIGLGARIHAASPVVRIERRGRDWRVTTAAGSVTAPRLLVATNAYSAAIAGAPWPPLSQELAILPYFQAATPPLPPELRAAILPQGHGAWDTARILVSFRMEAQGRLVFGSIGSLAGWSRETQIRFAARRLARLFPALRGIGFEHAWDGRIGMTGDGVPRLHRLADGVLSLGGYNGRGIAPGTVFGLAAADALLGDDSALPLPVTELQARRLHRLVGALYAGGSHLAHAIAARSG